MKAHFSLVVFLGVLIFSSCSKDKKEENNGGQTTIETTDIKGIVVESVTLPASLRPAGSLAFVSENLNVSAWSDSTKLYHSILMKVEKANPSKVVSITDNAVVSFYGKGIETAAGSQRFYLEVTKGTDIWKLMIMKGTAAWGWIDGQLHTFTGTSTTYEYKNGMNYTRVDVTEVR